MSKLLLTFYGDDFTGSTDALEQLTLAGIRTFLFIKVPTAAQLARFRNLRALGVAGMTRSMTPAAMEKVLRPALKQLKALRPRHVHYKVCSTFDSSPRIGSIGRAIDVGLEVFKAGYVPVLAAAPTLGRYTVFGHHFARFGIGSTGAIHRLDRHPSISRHPVTPMTEADLRFHLSKQTKKRIALFDILKLSLPCKQARQALEQVLKEKPDVILFDALYSEHLSTIGRLMEDCASVREPLFSVGSSGVEMALGAHLNSYVRRRVETDSDTRGRSSSRTLTRPKQILVGSGSCSPVTSGQIAWALDHGFHEIALDPVKLTAPRTSELEVERGSTAAVALLRTGRSVIVHTTRGNSNRWVTAKLKQNTAKALGGALGTVLRMAIERSHLRRLCIAGGDTSSYAARTLGIEAVEMIAPLTPGAPICRAYAPRSPAHDLEVVFKGGQVGPQNYFGLVERGKP